jgi:ParB family chromosome partitioning protein
MPHLMTTLTRSTPAVNISVRKLADITLNNEYLRSYTDVSTLKKSIESVGLIHPVTINSKNELLAGARRFQAAKELGWKEIPVHVIDRDALVQELISIDENLVRMSLTGLELEKYLNRGREIYEQIHPTANKVTLSTEALSAEEKQQQKALEEQDEDSFAAVTADKTGLSKSVIKSAIRRDALASDAVKRARGEGELNATKTNELIKLDKEAQERILPLVANKTAKETRRIVAAAREGGLDAALEESEKLVPLPREYSLMLSPMKRVNRSISRILIEELRYEGPEQRAINNELITLKNNLVQYFEMMGIDA